MSRDFKFPDLGEGIAEGELVKWLIQAGDSVKEDQEVAEVETDKALVSIPSPMAGVVEKLHFKEGERVQVGAVLITFSDNDQESPKKKEAPEKKPDKPESQDKSEPKKEPPSASKKSSSSSEPETSEEPKESEASQAQPTDKQEKPTSKPTENKKSDELPPLASPYTRKVARELGVNLADVTGSGPQGRISEEDVRQAAAGKKSSGPKPSGETDPAKVSAQEISKYGKIERIAVKGVRRKISEHMLTASQQTVMVTHMDEAEVGKLLKIREDKLKYAEKRGVKLTLLPFLMKACVIALRNYPYLNASLIDDEIILKKFYHFGFAVDTEAGLIVPVIRDIDQKSILRIAVELKDLSEKARNRSIPLEELRGHSFSITNIGSIGGKAFTPIINYPDSAILGLGRTYEKPVVHDGEIRAAWVLPLCLTFDHRVTDGATAARFTNEVIKYLQDPDLLLLDDGEA